MPSRLRLAHQLPHPCIDRICTHSIFERGDPWKGRLADSVRLSERNNVEFLYGSLRYLIFQSKYIQESRRQAWFEGVKRATRLGRSYLTTVTHADPSSYYKNSSFSQRDPSLAEAGLCERDADSYSSSA